jgi:glyoxylase-like metal-dependent hydrolase (beta-lactamase superfamily II)
MFPAADALIAGDAVVMLNPYTGSRGPQLVARAATADSSAALASLDRIADTAATTVLTGHGEVWRAGAAQIADAARARGLS